MAVSVIASAALGGVAQAGVTPINNNNFVNARSLGTQESGSLPGQSNVGATLETDEPVVVNQAETTSVWYSWTPTFSGTVEFRTVLGTLNDSTLGVYTGSSVGALTQVVTNDDYPPGVSLASRVSFTATAGTTYRIRVAGPNASQGTFTLQWERAPVWVDAPVARVQGAKVTVTYAAAGNVLSYDCALGSATPTLCPTPYVNTTLPKGTYTLNIQAISSFGNTADTSVEFTIKSGKNKV